MIGCSEVEGASRMCAGKGAGGDGGREESGWGGFDDVEFVSMLANISGELPGTPYSRCRTESSMVAP